MYTALSEPQRKLEKEKHLFCQRKQSTSAQKESAVEPSDENCPVFSCKNGNTFQQLCIQSYMQQHIHWESEPLLPCETSISSGAQMLLVPIFIRNGNKTGFCFCAFPLLLPGLSKAIQIKQLSPCGIVCFRGKQEPCETLGVMLMWARTRL